MENRGKTSERAHYAKRGKNVSLQIDSRQSRSVGITANGVKIAAERCVRREKGAGKCNCQQKNHRYRHAAGLIHQKDETNDDNRGNCNPGRDRAITQWRQTMTPARALTANVSPNDAGDSENRQPDANSRVDKIATQRTKEGKLDRDGRAFC